MCLTEQEMVDENIAIKVCERGSWGCFCGYHDGVDREPTHVEVAEMRRLRGLAVYPMDEFVVAYERDHESYF